jgi:peptidoglycan/LPS O-acetylase OafA/YrhL
VKADEHSSAFFHMAVTNNTTTGRFDALTGIRAIAAIMVFGYHFRKFWREDIPGWVLNFLNECHTGVSVFFVLSGFLIAYTYRDRPLESKKDYLKYILVRLVRIFPVYLLILTAKYIDTGFPLPKETLLNYTLTKGLYHNFALSGIAQSWSLTTELCFYFLAPVIFFLLKRSILKTIFTLLSLTAITFCIGYGWYEINGNAGHFLYDWHFIFNTTFSGRFTEFLAGMMLANFVSGDIKRLPVLSKKYNTLTGGILMIACIYLLSFFEKDIYAHGTDTVAGMFIRNILFPFVTIRFFYGLIIEKTWVQKFLSFKWMLLLGNASYIFYLIHINYGYSVLEKWKLFPDRNFVMLWIASIILYLLVEKPSYNFLKKLIRQK